MPSARPARRSASLADGVSLGRVGGQVLRRHPRLVRPPALGLRPRRQRRTAGDRLQAAPAAAHAGRPVGIDDDVADVTGIAGRTLDEPVVQDQAAADPGRDDHAEHVAPAAARAAPVLAGGHADGVVVHPDRQLTAAEPGGQPVLERERAPARDVQRRDQPGRPLHRAAAAAADPGQLGRVVDLRGVEHLHQQVLQGAPQRLGVEVVRRRHLVPGDHAGRPARPRRRRSSSRRCRWPGLAAG